MILEVADIRITPGSNAEFELAIRRGLDAAIAPAKGFKGFQVRRGVESPERYLLTIEWDTLDNHMVDFRQSPAFALWRSIVGPFFAEPPRVEHFELVARSE
jgi:heme-degrading monooxygenase HmoA